MEVKVYIIGNEKEEHTTYVCNEDGKCFKFYATKYEGTRSSEIISFLEFLGCKPFVIHNDKFKPSEVVNKKY